MLRRCISLVTASQRHSQRCVAAFSSIPNTKPLPTQTERLQEETRSDKEAWVPQFRMEESYENPRSPWPRFEELIGNTPLIDLTSMLPVSEQRPDVKILGKAEFLNPGMSMKDRIVRHIFAKASERGDLQPGGTIVAATSGNTGASVAMLAAMKGYKAIIVTNEKCSKEKVDALKAYGAEVIVGPAGIPADHPDHYQNIASRLAAENPGYFDVNQYDNLDNPEAHYLTTGPEIWKQTGGAITHFVAAGSTGGTISGVGRYLKEQNPEVQVIMPDPVGSVFFDYFTKGEISQVGSFKVEGIGKDSIPGAFDKSVVDHMMHVTDLDAFNTCAALAHKEGILVGGSAGANVWAAMEVALTAPGPAIIVTILCDSGVKYLSKVFNPEYLSKNGLC